MPTYDFERAFMRDYRKMTQAQRRAFRRAVAEFVQDLIRGEFRPGLRVKRVEFHPGVWEMTWAPDGRATFSRGEEIRSGDPHIIWRRIGTHDIFREP